ncbi:MAG: hypothetical protein K2Q22_08250 [Cytophagales bacterium]|nr:hypothetical protein [Cytophagales bacterium]
MKSLWTLVGILLLILPASSQVIKFTIVHAESKLPLEGVEVFSHGTKKKPAYTDKSGFVQYDIDHTDTMIFFKQNFHPLYIQIKTVNFDDNHSVVLKLAPSKGDSEGLMTKQYDKLQRSEYHFEHDSIPNSSIRITSFRSPSLSGYPMYNDKAFHVAEINLDKPNSTRTKSSYLKK